VVRLPSAQEPRGEEGKKKGRGSRRAGEAEGQEKKSNTANKPTFSWQESSHT